VIQIRCERNYPGRPCLGLIDQSSYLVSQALMPLFRFMGGNLQRNSEELLWMIA
jgi:hypothetical protein